MNTEIQKQINILSKMVNRYKKCKFDNETHKKNVLENIVESYAILYQAILLERSKK